MQSEKSTEPSQGGPAAKSALVRIAEALASHFRNRVGVAGNTRHRLLTNRLRCYASLSQRPGFERESEAFTLNKVAHHPGGTGLESPRIEKTTLFMIPIAAARYCDGKSRSSLRRRWCFQRTLQHSASTSLGIRRTANATKAGIMIKSSRCPRTGIKSGIRSIGDAR